MKIYYIRYTGPNRSHHMIIIPIGHHDGKIVCLDAAGITKSGLQWLSDNWNKLEEMKTSTKIRQIKAERPDLMKACKTIYPSRMKVIAIKPVSNQTNTQPSRQANSQAESE